MEAFDFGLRLKELREQKHMTQESVAKRLGVTRATVSGWEHNTKTPGIDTLESLADLFNVSADYLLNRNDRVHVYIDDFSKKQQDAIIKAINALREGFLED